MSEEIIVEDEYIERERIYVIEEKNNHMMNGLSFAAGCVLGIGGIITAAIAYREKPTVIVKKDVSKKP